MSKLVRARSKRVEYWPEWAKCCPQMLKSIEEIRSEVLMRSGSAFIADEVECCFCGRIEVKRPYARTVSGKPFSLEGYDLDEGPLEQTA